jgi:hypothetical protein
MYLTYMQALLLQEISKSTAEVFKNCEPMSIYVNNRQTGAHDDVISAIEKCKKHLLLEEKAIGGDVYHYTVSTAGREELERHFGQEVTLDTHF